MTAESKTDCHSLEDPIPQEPRKLTDILPSNDFPLLALLKVSQAAVIVADEQSNIVFWNLGAETMFGYNADEIVGKALTVIMPERYRAAHMAGIRRVREGDKNTLLASKVIGRATKLEGLRKDGSEFPLELQVVIYVQNSKICFLATCTNLSETVKNAVAKGIEKELTDALDSVHNNLKGLGEKMEKIDQHLPGISS